jgi:hypothetical protein
MRMKQLWAVAILCAAVSVAEAETVTLHIAPNGNDNWTGPPASANADRTDAPLASLDGARNAVRRLKATQKTPAPIRVIFASGTYRLTKPVVFTPDDGGTVDAPITYQAAKGARPVISGGRRITGFRAGDDGVWQAKTKLKFEQLYVNNRWAQQNRNPNVFYHYTLRKVEYGLDPITRKTVNLSNRAFIARPGEGKYLRILDSPKHKHAFNPHFFYEPGHFGGVTTFAFDIRVAADTQMHYEWRQSGHPYRTGPSMAFDGVRVRVGGKVLTELPAGKWVRIAITGGVGAASDGTWDLSVTPRGGEAKTFKRLTIVHKDWKRLDWMGFSSTSTTKTAFGLDNLSLTNKARSKR